MTDLPNSSSSRPDKFYRFQSVASPERMGWLRQTILESQIYFSSPADFNDPFDCRIEPSFKACEQKKREFLESIAKQSEYFGSSNTDSARKWIEGMLVDPKQEFFKRNYKENLHRVIERGLSCLCVSERFDEILMWSHYAEFHRGVCLIFAAGKMFPDYLCEPVKYQNEYPNVDFFETYKTSEGRENLAKITLFTKAKQWKYEKEWRICRLFCRHGLYGFDPACLIGLIFGCAARIETIETIREIATKRKPPLKLFQAKLKEHEYGLTIEHLET